jgi:hypothetical protein
VGGTQAPPLKNWQFFKWKIEGKSAIAHTCATCFHIAFPLSFTSFAARKRLKFALFTVNFFAVFEIF